MYSCQYANLSVSVLHVFITVRVVIITRHPYPACGKGLELIALQTSLLDSFLHRVVSIFLSMYIICYYLLLVVTAINCVLLLCLLNILYSYLNLTI